MMLHDNKSRNVISRKNIAQKTKIVTKKPAHAHARTPTNGCPSVADRTGGIIFNNNSWEAMEPPVVNSTANASGIGRGRGVSRISGHRSLPNVHSHSVVTTESRTSVGHQNQSWQSKDWKQHIPIKPGKLGIKLWMLYDVYAYSL